MINVGRLDNKANQQLEHSSYLKIMTKSNLNVKKGTQFREILQEEKRKRHETGSQEEKLTPLHVG